MDASADTGAGKPLVVGHSAACTLAWLAADARPEKVAGVALIGGFVLRLDTCELIGAFVQLVGAIFVFNLVALVYRLVAIVDAYRKQP